MIKLPVGDKIGLPWSRGGEMGGELECVSYVNFGGLQQRHCNLFPPRFRDLYAPGLAKTLSWDEPSE